MPTRSPAGWSAPALATAVSAGDPVPVKDLPSLEGVQSLRVRSVPPALPKLSFLTHRRLRRTSPISHFFVAAALEALGEDAARVRDGSLRLGIVACTMTGCVQYSRRFYDETLRDPATASPLIFPETVFNAPASHLAALLGTTAINYSLVGDPATYLTGLALGAAWLQAGRVEGCLVIGSEELDWVTAEASRMFSRSTILSEGAGALYLRVETPGDECVRLRTISSPHSFFDRASQRAAVATVRHELGTDPAGQAVRPAITLLCDSRQDQARADDAESRTWKNWVGPRLSPKRILGEGLMATAAWQCVLAADALRARRCSTAWVSVAGTDAHAVGAVFSR